MVQLVGTSWYVQIAPIVTIKLSTKKKKEKKKKILLVHFKSSIASYAYLLSENDTHITIFMNKAAQQCLLFTLGG